MPIDTLLEKARKYELDTVTVTPDFRNQNVAFTGTLEKHPYNKDKIILVADPFSTRLSYYEFNIADIGGVEELPSLVTAEGESVTMFRLWIRKGGIGIQSVPFMVADTTSKA